ncbi:hypothetical protein I5485_20065 [Citrobacter farmeri]|uniref:hypothetical protein n=1 Tax=Citrobacter farmeri TaxID=67824 RepID=UPI0019088D15|nr:hypothetical protein [Citrobacter farmeri]MBJ9164733.1 hypothetical protein [Citrobacter farmeri]
MSNISYLILFVTSVVSAIGGISILYYFSIDGTKIDMYLFLYVIFCFVIYIQGVKIFHQINISICCSGIVYFIVFAYGPLLIGLMGLVENIVTSVCSFFECDVDAQNNFLGIYELNIYIAIISFFALSIAWLFDTLLKLVIKIIRVKIR